MEDLIGNKVGVTEIRTVIMVAIIAVLTHIMIGMYLRDTKEGTQNTAPESHHITQKASMVQINRQIHASNPKKKRETMINGHTQIWVIMNRIITTIAL